MCSTMIESARDGSVAAWSTRSSMPTSRMLTGPLIDAWVGTIDWPGLGVSGLPSRLVCGILAFTVATSTRSMMMTEVETSTSSDPAAISSLAHNGPRRLVGAGGSAGCSAGCSALSSAGGAVIGALPWPSGHAAAGKTCAPPSGGPLPRYPHSAADLWGCREPPGNLVKIMAYLTRMAPVGARNRPDHGPPPRSYHVPGVCWGYTPGAPAER